MGRSGSAILDAKGRGILSPTDLLANNAMRIYEADGAEAVARFLGRRPVIVAMRFALLLAEESGNPEADLEWIAESMADQFPDVARIPKARTIRARANGCKQQFDLTPKQAATLRFIEEYIGEHGYAPAFNEIADRFNLAGAASCYSAVNALERKGYIRRAGNRPRSITIIHDKERNDAKQTAGRGDEADPLLA